MRGFRFVAGEFHAQFWRNALIRQHACEAVPQGVERAAGKFLNALALHRSQVQASLLLSS